MKLRVLWFYHDIMDLYGDKGNIKVIQKRCADRGIEVIIDTLAIGSNHDIDNYDILFIGGGADREQNIIYKDLLSRKESLIRAMNDKTFILLICGGYQLFGQYYLDRDNNKIEGLDIFDYYTEANTKGRCIGNIVIEAELDNKKMMLIGFENHGGQTHNVAYPLGKVISGHGNCFQGQFEGFYLDNVLGTYMHGPLLPKNPELADFIIKQGLKKRYGEVQLSKLNDEMEEKAREMLIKLRLKHVVQENDL